MTPSAARLSPTDITDEPQDLDPEDLPGGDGADEADEARLDLDPDVGPTGPFEEWQLPSGDFMLRDQDGYVDGPFDPNAFVRDDSTGTYYAQTEGRPLFLRVIHSSEDMIDCVDGGGEPFRYDIIPAQDFSSQDEPVPADGR